MMVSRKRRAITRPSRRGEVLEIISSDYAHYTEMFREKQKAGAVGFANTLTDARRTGPSLYIAVCGRRDVSLPRNIQKRRQKDEETRLTWYLKDEVMRRRRKKELAKEERTGVRPSILRFSDA
jgi:hypothetical protein